VEVTVLPLKKMNFSELKDGDSVGGLTNTLDIPNSANIDIPVKKLWNG